MMSLHVHSEAWPIVRSQSLDNSGQRMDQGLLFAAH